jgi:hypothetical protein
MASVQFQRAKERVLDATEECAEYGGYEECVVAVVKAKDLTLN